MRHIKKKSLKRKAHKYLSLHCNYTPKTLSLNDIRKYPQPLRFSFSDMKKYTKSNKRNKLLVSIKNSARNYPSDTKSVFGNYIRSLR